MASDHPSDPTDLPIDLATRLALEEERRMVTGCPEVDELVAFQEGRLSESRADEIRQHLSLCPDCAEDLLDLRAFDDPEPVALEMAIPGDDPESAEKSWQRYQASLEEARAAESTPTPLATRRQARTASRPAAHWLVAASALFALTGLWAWWSAVDLWWPGSAAIPSAPFPLTLHPDGSTVVRDGSTLRTFEVGSAYDSVSPTLLLGDTTDHDHYRAELQDSQGRVVFDRNPLPRLSDGRFALSIPRPQMPAGQYAIHLLGVLGGEERPLAVYSFVIRDVD